MSNGSNTFTGVWKFLVIVAFLVSVVGVFCLWRWQSRTRTWLVDELIPRVTFHTIGGPPDPNKPPDPPPPF